MIGIMRTDQTKDRMPFARFWRHVFIGFFTVARCV